MKTRNAAPLSHHRQPKALAHPRPLVAALALAWALQTHSAPHQINLPAQPLAESIKALARQAGMTIAADDALLAGKQAPAVRGNLEPADALQRLLQGSGLQGVQERGNWLLRPATPASGAGASSMELPRVIVRSTTLPTHAADPVQGYLAPRSTLGTKMDADVKDIPQAIVVVTSDLLRDRAVAKVTEVADTVAGVTRASSYGGNGASATFLARGFEALMLRDGLRLNPQGFGDALDVSTIERVEVLKGPASVLYGASEPGGTVNLVSKKPFATFGGEATVAFDSFGTGRAELDLNTPISGDDTLLFRINVAREQGDTYRDFVRRDNTLVAPTLQWNPAVGTRVTAQYEYLRSKSLFDRGLGRTFNYAGSGIDYQSLPVERFIGEPNVGPSRSTTSQGILTLEHDFSPDWHMRLAYSDNRFDYDNQPEIGLSSFDAETGLFNRYFDDYSTQGERTRNLVFDLSGKFNLGGIEHNVLIGVDRIRNKAWYVAVCSTPDPAPIDVRNPVYTGYSGYETFFCFSGLQGSNAHAHYVQDMMTLSPQWKLLLAARRDEADRFSGGFPGQPDDNGVVNRSRFGRTSPRAGLIYQPTAQDSFYASYSTSFSPSQFINLRQPETFTPEIGKQIELGWKRDWAGRRLSSTLSLFDIHKRNVAVSDPTNGSDEFFEVQVGEFRSRGIEFDLAGSPWRGLRLTAGLGYAEVTVTRSIDPNLPVGDRLPQAPRVTASLWMTQDLAPSWSLGAGIFHASSASVSLPDDGQNQPAYTRLDATLTWAPTAWRIQLSGKNLGNAKYYTTGNTLMPQAPRHAVLSASYQF